MTCYPSTVSGGMFFDLVRDEGYIEIFVDSCELFKREGEGVC
jgi:hypothetical protein